MKVSLMHKDRDFDANCKLPPNERELTQDLSLNTLFDAMASGDAFLFEVAKRSVLSGVSNDAYTILYRQGVVKDCLKNAAAVRTIYDIASEALEKKKRHYFDFFYRTPDSLLYGSLQAMTMLLEQLELLKNAAGGGGFESEGFRAFFAMLARELDADFFAGAREHLLNLKFYEGALLSAELGKGNKSVNYALHKHQPQKRGWREWFYSLLVPPADTIYIDERDQSGLRALSEIKNRGINPAAAALARAADHILAFFNALKTELAFYLGCLNLHAALLTIGAPVSFPAPAGADSRVHRYEGLYDPCLSLTMNRKLIGNALDAGDKCLVIITGANQGGKSTLLRGIGLAQLMMQCGMFVAADSFCANACDGIFTHFKREEDAAMNRGKLDEELARMNDIVNGLTRNSMLLFNESFAATNEREGSEIARQITGALIEKRVKTFFVTHLYSFARDLFENKTANAVFLRAEREASGGRTYKIFPGAPLQTSYGEDLYKRVFETDD